MFKPAALATSVALVLGLNASAQTPPGQGPTPPSSIPQPQPEPPRQPLTPAPPKTPQAPSGRRSGLPDASEVFEKLKPSASAAFLKKAAQGDQAEIDLAKLALARSSHARVKSLARMLQLDHQQANQKVQALAASRNVTLPADISNAAHEAKTRLAKLEAAAFDEAYVDQVVKDHTAAIHDFEQASRMSDADVRAFAETTLPTLKKHLQAAQDLQKAAGERAGG
jgi:putative membrane protein